MKNRNNTKSIGKWIMAILCISLILCSLAGCKTVVQPEAGDKVYSVNLQFDGKNVDGQLTLDLSMESVSLKAKVMQDGTSTVTYDSSNPSVATIDANGKLTLISVGETAVVATAGGKTHSIVVIVKNDYQISSSYAITVSGGVAKNQNGEIVTSARAGDYLTLVPSMPDHKDFIEWQYSESGLWINGNVIKMPANDLTATAKYEDTLYELTLVGATVTKAGQTDNPAGTAVGGNSIENAKTSYKFAYGTEITVVANTPANTRMFVGWDQDFENNRVGDEGVTQYSFAMNGENTTISAIFSNINHNILPGNNKDSAGESTSIFDGNGLTGVTAKKITAGVIEGNLFADADLQSLYGYSFSIPGNTAGVLSTKENILKSDLNTRDVLEPQTIKLIFKNRGNYSLNVELGYSYFGNVGSSGIVTIPAGGIVTRIFNANIGLNDCSWSFSIRENVGGTADETVELDVVASAAQTYPGGYPLLNSSKDAEYMTFSGAMALKSGWKNGGSRATFKDKGAQLFVSRASNMNATQASACAKVANLPAYDAANPTTTVYVQVFNLVNVIDNPKNKFTIMFSNSTDAFDANAKVYASAVVDIQEAGQIVILKLELPRTASDGDVYMHFVKYEKEEGMEYNVFAQFAYNNIFGYEE